MRAWGRFVGSGLILGVLVWRLGTGPFLHGLHAVDGTSLAAAAVLGAVSTGCYAWRWQTVAAGLGIRIALAAAVAAYYRALFLNVTLPGGVVGDVHRGVRHGRDVNDLSRAFRAVVLERIAGQFVQSVLTLVVLLVLRSPVGSPMPRIAVALLGGMVAVVLVFGARPGGVRSTASRLRSAVVGDIRGKLLGRKAWLGIALASAVGVAAHVITFLIAAQTAGITAPASRMLPIALLVMLAMVLPSVGGWGPREGVAAWAFGAAGFGAQRGVAAAVVYGVMVFVASLPGAVVLVVSWCRQTRLATLHP